MIGSKYVSGSKYVGLGYMLVGILRMGILRMGILRMGILRMLGKMHAHSKSLRTPKDAWECWTHATDLS